MASKETSLTKNLSSLRISFAGLVVATVIVLFLGYWLLATFWHQVVALRWGVVSAFGLGYQLIVLWRDLPLNVLANKRSFLPVLGLGTWISFGRLLGIGLMFGFLGLPLPPSLLAWIPFGLYLVANLCDLLDGYAARRAKQATLLGQKLDQDLDGRGLLVACLLAFQYGTVAWWFLMVGLARYLFVFGIWVRRRRRVRIFELNPNPGRRALAGTQMGVTTAMLAPILLPPATIVASTLFMFPFLWNFWLDWLQVSGRTNVSKRWHELAAGVWSGTQGWLPLFLRLMAIAFLGCQVTLGRVSGPIAALQLIFAAAIGLGIASRVASVAVLIETSLVLQSQPATIADWALIMACTGLLFIGSGAHSLWTPEENWIALVSGAQNDFLT